jgi:hypothetical protein
LPQETEAMDNEQWQETVTALVEARRCLAGTWQILDGTDGAASGVEQALHAALAALSDVTVALVAAGPAAAESKTPTAPAKKGCEVQLKGPGAGQNVVYPHGYSFSSQAQDNKTHTYACNDGT